MFSQTTLSFVVLDKDTNAIKMIKDERGDFMGSCNLSLTEVSLKARQKKTRMKKRLHRQVLGTLRPDYEYEIECENDFRIFG